MLSSERSAANGLAFDGVCICVDGDVCLDIGVPSFRDWQNTSSPGAFVLRDYSIVECNAWTSQRGHIRRLSSHELVTVSYRRLFTRHCSSDLLNSWHSVISNEAGVANRFALGRYPGRSVQTAPAGTHRRSW